MTTGIVDTVDLTDYDLCTSFIADNNSDSHVINHFYQDHLTNICFTNDIKEVLYMSDFIINIISMRLAKQQVNLFFKIQFEQIYDANDYIHAIMQEICNQ